MIINLRFSLLPIKKSVFDILNSNVGKIIRKHKYEECLVKWKRQTTKDSLWLSKEEVDHLDFCLNT